MIKNLLLSTLINWSIYDKVIFLRELYLAIPTRMLGNVCSLECKGIFGFEYYVIGRINND